MRALSRPLCMLAALAGVAVVAGCRESRSPAAAAAERVRPTYDTASGRLTRLEYDSNGDGKIDTWGYMDGMRVVRVEVDEDGDGRVDRWEYHEAVPDGAASSAGIDRTLARIERATRHDGRVSRWEYFDHGVLARVEEDTDGDGKVDKWEQYRNGALAEMALDTTGAGTPDRRLLYKPDGSLDRIINTR